MIKRLACEGADNTCRQRLKSGADRRAQVLAWLRHQISGIAAHLPGEGHPAGHLLGIVDEILVDRDWLTRFAISYFTDIYPAALRLVSGECLLEEHDIRRYFGQGILFERRVG